MATAVLDLPESQFSTTIETQTQQSVYKAKKTFYLLLANTLLTSVTNMTVWFALTYFVYLETHSVFASSVVAGIYLVAGTLSGFWFGGLVDRYKKKHVMQFSALATLLLYMIAGAVYLLAPVGTFKNPASAILWIFTTLLLLGVIAGNLRSIALPTVVTLLFPERERARANGLTGTVSGIAFLLVSVISGLLLGLSGMFWVLIAAVSLLVISVLHLTTLSFPDNEAVHTDKKPVKLDIRGTLTIIGAVPGLFALIFFTTFNNFLGGVFMSLMDPYGLALVSVEVWGFIWGFLSLGFIIGGLLIAKRGVGKNPLRSLFLANGGIWLVSSVFTIQPSIILLMVGMFLWLCIMPLIEASEQTILQKVVPFERQGRVFGFAQSVETAASPLTAFFVGPITQFVFIPFMTTGAGVELIGGWFGTGPDRGIALVFTLAGVIGLLVTIIAMRSKPYRMLAQHSRTGESDNSPTSHAR
jgi:DHA3 family multidrug efflux protein-like MFS transporter